MLARTNTPHANVTRALHFKDRPITPKQDPCLQSAWLPPHLRTPPPLPLLPQKGGGLGIQVKPYYSPSLGLSSRVEAGLEIQRVVPGGRMEREGKLRVGDRIIEINGQSLTSVSFVK